MSKGVFKGEVVESNQAKRRGANNARVDSLDQALLSSRKLHSCQVTGLEEPNTK